MNGFRMLLFAALACGASPLIAQVRDCPYERAAHVGPQWTVGPSYQCDTGIDITVGGVGLKSTIKSCPMFVLITPSHDTVEASTTPTRVTQIGTVQEVIAFYKCRTTYFLFIATGSVCELDQTMNTGALPLLATAGCVLSSGV